MSVIVETTLGDITIDLFIKERPRACLNFLKLCKVKYFNFNLFHTISRGFIAQTGDPTGSRNGGESIFGVIEGALKRYFEAERNPRIKHTTMGLVSFVGTDDNMIGSQFFITLGNDLTYLDERHCIFGEVMEGLDVLELLNETICDQDNRPYQDVRITHTVVLDDPFPDPDYLQIPERSPSPSMRRLRGGRIAPDEEIDETQGKSTEEVNEIVAAKEAKARATILEMIGDIPDADMAPPENVLFVCKLNPVTTDDDLEIIFSRFGKINSCEVIRDKKTGESLQYAFVEFDDKKACEDAYFKMDNVLIDDRRIHVDFSQSVAKVKWHGKGRGVTTYDDRGNKSRDKRNDLGNGKYNKKSSDRKTVQYRTHGEQFRYQKPEQIQKPKYERNERKEQRHKLQSEKYNYHDKTHYSKEKLYKYDNKKYSNEKYLRKYEDHKSHEYRSDHRLERSYDRKGQYRSRSRSHEEYKSRKDYKQKYDEKEKSSTKTTKSKDNSDYKKKYYSSSDEDSSTEDSSSSEDSSDKEYTHRKKNSKKSSTHSKHKKSKKTKKKSQKEHNTSSSEDS